MNSADKRKDARRRHALMVRLSWILVAIGGAALLVTANVPLQHVICIAGMVIMQLLFVASVCMAMLHKFSLRRDAGKQQPSAGYADPYAADVRYALSSDGEIIEVTDDESAPNTFSLHTKRKDS